MTHFSDLTSPRARHLRAHDISAHISRCPDSFLAQLPADEAHAYLSAQVADHDRTASETAGSIVIEHGNPCLMRQFPLRPLHVVLARLARREV